MLEKWHDPGGKYFNCTDAERAVFEAGIKLGTIYHQYVGAPLSEANVEVLEKAIEDGARVQPFVADVKVKIDRKYLRRKRSAYKYVTLTAAMLEVQIKTRYKDMEALCEMRYIEELDYPLMYVREVKRVQA